MSSILKSLNQVLNLSLTVEQAKENLIELLEARQIIEYCSQCPGRKECKRGGLTGTLDPDTLKTSYYKCRAEKSYQLERKQERLMNNSRIPHLLTKKNFANFKPLPHTKQAFHTAQKVAKNPNRKGIVLAGDVGVGKSHLAAAIYNFRIEQGSAAVFARFPGLLSDIKATYETDLSTTELMEIIREAELLVLDDVGVEKVTDWSVEQIWSIVDSRLNQELQTVVTTNFHNPIDLIDYIGGLPGQRIVSRLSELCDWITIEGEDYRLNF